MNREGKKCVLYPRVSTEMQVDGYSLEGQKNSLKRFADREEMEIVGIYEDAGKSGKSIEGRPAFKKMLADIKNGLEIEYILVYKLSRFGRNAADILNSLEFVQSYGINLICIEEGIDSSQTSGKLLISVLSAVAEIERENIIEQTMNGRREKARQGGWNGGFAPYGYYLKDNQLLIEETEAEAIRIIFDKFGNSDIGLGGVAKYLNLQGIKKIPRQNGKLETWSSHLIRQILDNPVYCGKIAYGRRTREKVKGTKNEYKQVHTDDYILEDGQHEGIVSEELWQKVHAKRKATGIKQPSKVGKDRAHLLTGVLKCPICGSSMYTNKHAWTNKDGTYKEVYYYICGRNKQERGHHCDYKASLRKTDIEPLVVEAVKELVSDVYFAKEIEKRIGVQTDTSTVDKELANYENKLKEVDLNKARLENEIDNLPADARYRERKIHDMTLRLDALYDTMVELEERIEDAKLRKSSIEMEAITLDNVYKIMQNFGKLYAIMSDEEKKSLITYLIKEIQIYPNGESEMPLKSIEFNFPIYIDGKEVRKVLWESGNTVEKEHVFRSEVPLDLSFVFAIQSYLKNTNAGELFYPRRTPRPTPQLNDKESLIPQILEKDVLLSYPFESMKSFINLLYEAAEDESVVSIKMTLYRLANKSQIVDALVEAAENGKEVVVLVELRARFDEENNIEYSRKLEEAGCRVIYGLNGYKVHSKLCLISRKTEQGVSYVTQIGTGNYNEKTSALYTDLSLITGNQEIGKEAAEVFAALLRGETVEETHLLLVAPKCLQNKVLDMIEEEIQHVKNGEEGYIGIKINSLTDKVIISKLVEASQAGVKIEMIVRGICCLIPGVKGYTENITVVSIVGRFLEHSRIYRFGTKERENVYIASADFMTRNTLRRVEVAAPVLDERLKNQLAWMFETMMKDDEKGKCLTEKGIYVDRNLHVQKLNSQECFYEAAYANAEKRQK